MSAITREQVAHLAGEAEPQAREDVRVTRAWLAGEATPAECRAATACGRASGGWCGSRRARRIGPPGRWRSVWWPGWPSWRCVCRVEGWA